MMFDHLFNLDLFSLVVEGFEELISETSWKKGNEWCIVPIRDLDSDQMLSIMALSREKRAGSSKGIRFKSA
jgi:hypothetical protein